MMSENIFLKKEALVKSQFSSTKSQINHNFKIPRNPIRYKGIPMFVNRIETLEFVISLLLGIWNLGFVTGAFWLSNLLGLRQQGASMVMVKENMALVVRSPWFTAALLLKGDFNRAS
jgi:hypothetical protein